MLIIDSSSIDENICLISNDESYAYSHEIKEDSINQVLVSESHKINVLEFCK
jgi:hypothetical protein